MTLGRYPAKYEREPGWRGPGARGAGGPGEMGVGGRMKEGLWHEGAGNRSGSYFNDREREMHAMAAGMQKREDRGRGPA